MSCQQSQQKCQLPAKCLHKCLPKCQPQAPAPSPSPCSPLCQPPPCPAEDSSSCVTTCSFSGFGSSCNLITRLPSVTLWQPPPSECCDNEPSGCFASGHGASGCN